MGETPSFAEMKAISANQQKSMKQQQELVDNQKKQLLNEKMALEMERMRLSDMRDDYICRNIQQSVDFALKSLPWWKRSPINTMRVAKVFYALISNETLLQSAMMNVDRVIDEAPSAKEIKLQKEEVV